MTHTTTQDFDVLIVGSGLAGLTAALQLAPTHRVAVITKRQLQDGSSGWAQGGIAAVLAEDDSFDAHVQDTLTAGAGLCDLASTRYVVENAPDTIAWLQQLGVPFSQEDGCLHLTREGGHSARRIVHATDATNAARTLLYDIAQGCWDAGLCALFDVPMAILPEVRDCAADFGVTRPDLFGREIPILGVAGDQQAATVGQACFAPGMVKSTYGTGCFMVMNTGSVPLVSRHRLLTTVAYRLDGRPTYALEGSIFIAGAAVQWLRDALRLIAHAGQTEALARELDSNDGVYLVPAFTGLGAPYWDPLARGTITGLSRDTGINHIVRAALVSVCYQSRDLLDAMRADGVAPASLRVDGGMAANDWLMQFLADMLALPVERPALTETTALGAAWLAGLGCGWYAGLDELAVQWHRQADFAPQMAADRRDGLYAGWRAAVERTLSGGVSG